MMNTSEVARILGVSSSTIQRWVKHLELPTERNERGHYLFNEQNIEILKEIQTQIQSGTLLQDLTPIREKKVRKGVVKEVESNKAIEMLNEKVRQLEKALNTKADSVTSYQILQHRSDIEELQNQVENLTKQLNTIQSTMNEIKSPLPFDQPPIFDQHKSKKKKKNLVSTWFRTLKK